MNSNLEGIKKIGKYFWQDNEIINKLEMNWNQAKEYCENLELGGLRNWYLPTKMQLLSLSNNHSKLSNNPKDCWYWRSDDHIYKENNYLSAYNVKLCDDGGETDRESPRITNSVRCVHN